MKLRYKILSGFLGLAVVAVVTLGMVLGHTKDCQPAPALSSTATLMQAVVYRCYGSPDILQLENVEKPVPTDYEVLIKVQAASVNPLDWHYMRGSPYIMRLGSGIGAPEDERLGRDFAGIVESVGNSVTKFKPGDKVFGGAGGAFAEYVVVREDRSLAAIPANVSFEQAAAVPVAALTALQALRDKGSIKPGQKVLINGASGGVGTFAVQIAKAYGAEVYGVCSTRNVELVRSLGADHVFDYKKEDYTDSDVKFDVIVDNVGNHSLSKNRKVMKPEGKFVIIGGPSGNWLGPLIRPLNAMVLSPFIDQEIAVLLAQLNKDDLQVLGDLMRDGKVTPVIDRRYSLPEVPDAIRYSEEGHARGKIIINLGT